ncbi:hypothetical protein ABK040_007592 [Willaertia magna]
MLYWIRTLYLFFLGLIYDKYWEENSKSITDEHEYYITVTPYDIDLNLHLNNAQYLSFMEHARFHMSLTHYNLFNRTRKAGMGWVVGGASFQFRRSAGLFERVKIVTKFAAADERWLYFEQNFFVKNKFIGRGIARVCCFDKKGAVSSERFFKEICKVNVEDLEERFRMKKEDHYDIVMNKVNSTDELLPRVSSFVFHDETLKQKEN